MNGIKAIIKLGKGFGIFKPIIFVRLFGGLGNQLFTYAAAKRLAIFNNCTLCVDSGSGFIRDRVYKRTYQLAAFEISSPTSIWGTLLGFIYTYSRRIIHSINNKLPQSNKIIVQQKQIPFDTALLTLQIKKPVLFEGFWQSENYFKDVESVIRTEFRFKQSVVSDILLYVQKLNITNAVAIHVRHFKDEHHFNKGNVSNEYYKRAVEFFKTLIPDVEFWVFSDNPDRALQKFIDNDIKCHLISSIVKDTTEIQELFLMTQFRYFIIANSTFSWWGAWLSESKNKIVVAPAEVIDSGEGCWGFEGLLPREWITL